MPPKKTGETKPKAPKKSPTKKAVVVKKTVVVKKSPTKTVVVKKTVAKKVPRLDVPKRAPYKSPLKAALATGELRAYCVKSGTRELVKNPTIVATKYYKMKKGKATEETYTRYRIAGTATHNGESCKTSLPISATQAAAYKEKGMTTKTTAGIKTIKRKKTKKVKKAVAKK